MITTENIIIFSLTVLFLTAFLVFLFIKKRKKKKTLEKSMEMTLFSVRMPRYGGKKEDGEKETRKELISKMEQFFSNFLSINKDDSFFSGPTRVVFEIATDIGQGDISFYVAVPSKQSNLLKNYIHGVYSEAVMEKVPEDYTIFEPGGEVSISFLTQKETFFVPINTYEDLGRDPLEAIINSISSIEPSEGAAVQIIIRPSSVNLRKKGEAVL